MIVVLGWTEVREIPFVWTFKEGLDGKTTGSIWILGLIWRGG